MRWGPILLLAAAVGVVIFLVTVPQWSLPRAGTQLGGRASSMIQFAGGPADDRLNTPPPAIPAWAQDIRPATGAFKNVQVLKDVNAGEFMRLQTAMTQWVSPKQGCGFCHVSGDYASDAKPEKRAARLMLSMTRHINSAWPDHVGAEGVTCYSCHRGQPVPAQVWFWHPPIPSHPMIDRQEDYHETAVTVRKFFPDEGFEEYLLEKTPGLGQSQTPLPTGQSVSQIEIKRLYEVMMQMSDGIGVNCGFCHNSRAFFDWRQSTPNRWVGYSGIQMTRNINRDYLVPLAAISPLTRQGPGDVTPKVGNALANCATCHEGAPKPFGGANLLGSFPELKGPDPHVAEAAPAAPAS